MQLVAYIAAPGVAGAGLKGDLFDCSMHWHPDERDAACDLEEQGEISERLTGDLRRSLPKCNGLVCARPSGIHAAC